MDNQELLAQVTDMMRQQTEMLEKRFTAIDEQLSTMNSRQDTMDKRLDTVDERFDAVDKRFDNMDHDFNKKFDDISCEIIGTASQMLKDHTHEIKLILEHDVIKRLDAMLEGQKTFNDKLRKHDREIKTLQGQMEDTTVRVLVLESRPV